MESAEKWAEHRGLGTKAKNCLYEGVIVPTALYRAEAWGMRSAERRKVNVLEIKCFRSLVGVSQMHRRAGILLLLLLLLLLKEVGNARLGESD